MKNLLLVFLVVIFSLQTAFAAAGDRVAASGEVVQVTFLEADGADPADTDTDPLKVSAALEELSDYLPPDFTMPRNTSAAIAMRAAEARPQLVIPLLLTPPPRA